MNEENMPLPLYDDDLSKNNTQKYTVRHQKDRWDLFKKKAKQQGYKPSTLIRHWIESYINENDN